MPFSTPVFKIETVNHLKEKFDSTSTILDVGPGAGYYSNQLREFFPKMYGIEIFEPYIQNYNLTNKYEDVWVGNILDYDFEWYDIILLGDVLEHIDEVEAINLVKRIYNKCGEMVIAIPFNAPQGTWGGNVYETHLQPTLTHETFMEKYEGFRPLEYRNDYGVYVKI